jgi:hypothetical protein
MVGEKVEHCHVCGCVCDGSEAWERVERGRAEHTYTAGCRDALRSTLARKEAALKEADKLINEWAPYEMDFEERAIDYRTAREKDVDRETES